MFARGWRKNQARILGHPRGFSTWGVTSSQLQDVLCLVARGEERRTEVFAEVMAAKEL